MKIIKTEHLFDNEVIDRAYKSTDPDYWRTYVTYWKKKLNSKHNKLSKSYAEWHDLPLLRGGGIEKPLNDSIDKQLHEFLRLEWIKAEEDFIEYLKSLLFIHFSLCSFYGKNDSIPQHVSTLKNTCDGVIYDLYDWYGLGIATTDDLKMLLESAKQTREKQSKEDAKYN